MAEPTEEQIRGVRQAGISRGWSHENFITAYGSEGESSKPDYPARLDMETIDKRFRAGSITADERSVAIALRPVFAEAWEEGREFFRDNRWCDGSSMDDA